MGYSYVYAPPNGALDSKTNLFRLLKNIVFSYFNLYLSNIRWSKDHCILCVCVKPNKKMYFRLIEKTQYKKQNDKDKQKFSFFPYPEQIHIFGPIF